MCFKRNFIGVFLIGIMIALILLQPEICKECAIKAILLCGRIIIPSLFPFTMCILFIMKSGILSKLKVLDKFFLFVFGLCAEDFSLVLLSALGGYPVGAKLLSEAVRDGQLSNKKASIMINFCINAGPAFIISAVGVGFLQNTVAGYILFTSHIIASIIICLICRLNASEDCIKKSAPTFNSADNFVISASEASATVLNICSFVILFSVINGYIELLVQYIPIGYILYLTEVTNAVFNTKNIFLISFILGFGGICVWFQVFSAIKNVKINLLIFVIFRFLHGFLSVILTYIFLKIFPLSLPAISNNITFLYKNFYSTPALSSALFVTMVIFLIWLYSKKYKTKILEEFM